MTDPSVPGGQHDSSGFTSTGVPVVDDAMGALSGLDEAPLEEHHERLEQAHAALREALDADPPTPSG